MIHAKKIHESTENTEKNLRAFNTSYTPRQYNSRVQLSEISFFKTMYQSRNNHIEEVIIKVTVFKDVTAGSQHHMNISCYFNISHSSEFPTSWRSNHFKCKTSPTAPACVQQRVVLKKRVEYLSKISFCQKLSELESHNTTGINIFCFRFCVQPLNIFTP